MAIWNYSLILTYNVLKQTYKLQLPKTYKLQLPNFGMCTKSIVNLARETIL